jgi:hypothetical protein
VESIVNLSKNPAICVVCDLIKIPPLLSPVATISTVSGTEPTFRSRRARWQHRRPRRETCDSEGGRCERRLMMNRGGIEAARRMFSTFQKCWFSAPWNLYT